jgi:stage V sporulation protein B
MVIHISRKSLVTGALILTAAGIVTRVLGFVYRIYMSNVMGAEGMGLYQLIMPVYGLAWAISCSGFNTTVSKLTAQEHAKGEYGNMGRVLKQSVVITSSLGFILTVALYFGAEYLAAYFFKDIRTLLPLQILSLAFPFMAAGTCVRGYFIGLQETVTPAVNQVLEQIIRMTVVFLLAGWFVPRGLMYACAVAVTAIVAEEVFSLIYIFASYRLFKRRKSFRKKPTFTPTQSLSLIVAMALPLTANRITGSLLSAAENFLLPARLQMFGMSASQAISDFGRINGMAMPLILFPTAVLNALSVTLVPAVSEAMATKHMSRITAVANKSVLFAAVMGACAAGLFVVFGGELGMLIYKQPLGSMLVLLGLMCPVMYVQIILSGVLNGLGCQMFIFRNSVLSSILHITSIYFLVPQYGLNAYIAGCFLSSIGVIALEINKINKIISLDGSVLNWLAKPVLASAMAGVTARVLADKLFLNAYGNVFGLVAAIAVLIGMYLWLVWLMGCINKKDVLKLFGRDN